MSGFDLIVLFSTNEMKNKQKCHFHQKCYESHNSDSLFYFLCFFRGVRAPNRCMFCRSLRLWYWTQSKVDEALCKSMKQLKIKWVVLNKSCLTYLFPNAAAWPIFILYVESSTYHSMPNPPLPALHYQTTHPDPGAIDICIIIHSCRHVRRACLSRNFVCPLTSLVEHGSSWC